MILVQGDENGSFKRSFFTFYQQFVVRMALTVLLWFGCLGYSNLCINMDKKLEHNLKSQLSLKSHHIHFLFTTLYPRHKFTVDPSMKIKFET